MTAFHQFLVSDTLLAALIPIILLALSVHVLGSPKELLANILSSPKGLLAIILGPTRTPSTPTYFSVRRAAASYAQYARLGGRELTAMRASYGRMRWAHRSIAYELGYPKKLTRLEESIRTNARVAEGVARLARKQFPDEVANEEGIVLRERVEGDLGRVREAMKHFVRDWSEEGRVERDRIFRPILEVLGDVEPSERKDMHVLVPGAGLGRLAWEISQLGFTTTVNELSFFMNLALRFLLSEDTTTAPNQHVLQPYASWFSHQRATETLFRTVTFPDVVPRLSPGFSLAERDFLSLRPPPETDGFDAIVTLFFIDTSLNIIETLEHIHRLLRPGGRWINLGPLLWTSGGEAALELSLEEVLALADKVGFDVEGPDGPPRTARRTVECEYTADKTAMMKWLYQAEFCVGTKRA